MRRIVTTLLSVAMLAVAAAAPASANSERVTYGDVRAHFQTAEGGGSVGFQTGNLGAMTSAGSDIFRQSMRPFPGTPFDGNRYCELDWQLMALATLLSRETSGLPSMQAVRAAVNATEVTLKLDGNSIGPVKSTTVKKYLSTFIDLGGPGLWRQWGVFYAPGELAVGTHTLSAHLTIPGVIALDFGPATFHVDAAGTGACS